MDFINNLLPVIEHFTMLGYWLVFLFAFTESLAFVGLFIPGTMAVILAGFLAAQGYLDLGNLFWFVAVGAILGDGLSYYLGRRGAISFRTENIIFKPELLKKGEEFFKKRGASSVFWGRFIGWVRPVIPFVAGLFKLNKKVFLFWNVLSGLLWAAAHIALGYFFGQAWQTIVLWSTRTSILIAVLAGFLIVFYSLKWLVFKKGRQILSFIISLWRSIKEAVGNNEYIKKFISNHPRFWKFIKARLDKNKFSGLPLTVLTLAFIYALLLLGGIIEDVITSDVIVSVDARVANLLAIFRNPELTKFFLWVTLLGKWQVVLVFLLATICFFWILRRRAYIFLLLFTVIGSEAFTWAAKHLFRRLRPDTAVYTEHSFSFPSGHATIAMAFYGFIAFVLIRETEPWKKKVNYFFLGILLILFIGFSRLYLGVHYLSDVWGGYLVGLLALLISISMIEWLDSHQKVKKENILTKKSKIILLLVSLASLFFYVNFAVHYNPILLPSSNPPKNNAIIENVDTIFSNDQIKYTETLTGEKQEPLNFVIIADNGGQLIKIFKNAGWTLADKASFSSAVELAKSAALKEEYSAAPMTPSFWNKKPHNFGFEKPTAVNNARERHHARFWKTNFKTENGKLIYVGTASLDVGLKWGITHKIKPDIDTEREFLLKDLQKTGQVAKYQKKQLVESVLGKNFSGDPFFTDGKIYIIEF